MKKTALVFALSTFALTACSKPTDNVADKVEQTPPATATATPSNSTPVPDAHNSQNSLDWHGKYKGMLPCADCEGIETELKLNPDSTYELEEEYKGGKSLGKENKVTGKFSFDASGSMITLDQAANGRKFFVGENYIESRDRTTGEVLDKTLAERFKLQKDVD